jgi:hypothetical protein
LDDDGHKFLENKVLYDKDASLPIDYSIATTNIKETYAFSVRQNPLNPDDKFRFYIYGSDGTNGKGKQIDGWYKEAVDKAFQNFLAQPLLLPSPDVGVSAIQHWTMVTGEHKLYFRVTPEKADKNGDWVLEYKTYIVHPNGDKEQVFSGRMDNETSPGTIGKPLAAHLATTFPIVVSER